MGQGQSSIPTTEVTALVELYDALNGDRWRRRDGWKQPTRDPEQWFGVEVAMGHVVALELPANELSGCLPAASLRAAAAAPRARPVQEPAARRDPGRARNPLEPQARGFQLQRPHGAIPRQIGDCGLLQELNLYQNSLSGTMPKELGKLQSLRTLQLQHNNLCGALPEALCELTQLTKFSVRGNCLTGRIPADIGRMQSLVFLSLRNNELTGIIPPRSAAARRSSSSICPATSSADPFPRRWATWKTSSISTCSTTHLKVAYRVVSRGLSSSKSPISATTACVGAAQLPGRCSSLEAVMTKWKTVKPATATPSLATPCPSRYATHVVAPVLADA
ncbi:Leucine-rich repeat domain, L domain-like [Phytophthora cactorum]|nr:Leucine-rich repeat domain, L domain-like [Phytophthora cactorum]